MAKETVEVISKVVEVFQSHNPAWPHTKVVLSDKDFNKRKVFSKYFSHTDLKIHLFHVLRIIR